MNAWILIVVALNSTYAGSYSYRHDNPTVAMQEFGTKKSCLFARDVILKRAGDMADHLNIICIPKAE